LRCQRRPLDGGGWPCGLVLGDGQPARLGLLGLGGWGGCLGHYAWLQLQDMRRLSLACGIESDHLALAWVLSKPTLSVALVGDRTAGEVDTKWMGRPC